MESPSQQTDQYLYNSVAEKETSLRQPHSPCEPCTQRHSTHEDGQHKRLRERSVPKNEA